MENTWPHSLRQLEAFLREHPKVLCKCLNKDESIRWFVGMGAGIRFRRENGTLTYAPCTHNLFPSELGVDFDEKGFTVTKFGIDVRYDYLDEPTSFELVYGKGGHGGPYVNFATAQEAARRLLAGSQTENVIYIVPRSAPSPYDRDFAVAQVTKESERSEL